MDAAGKRALLHVQLAALERHASSSEDGTAAAAANTRSGHQVANGQIGYPKMQHGGALPAEEQSSTECVLISHHLVLGAYQNAQASLLCTAAILNVHMRRSVLTWPGLACWMFEKGR